jgi:hypothetical protein
MKRLGILVVLTLVLVLVFTACSKAETTTTSTTVPSTTSSTITTSTTIASTAPTTSTVPLLPVTTGGVAGITVSGATINGSFSGQAAGERGFDWGTSSGKYEYSWAESGSFPPGAFSRSITGLTEGTTYFFRCKARNAAGWGYGTEQSFRTLSPAKITAATPNTAKQGDNLEVTITGSGFNDATAVSFGDNITVNKFSVTSDAQISANVTIAVRAAGGNRTVSVTTPAGAATLANAFTVERVLRTVVWTDTDFNWLSHFLTGEIQYTYNTHFTEGNKMSVTSAQNFIFGVEVRGGKLCFTDVPANAWNYVYNTARPYLSYDSVSKVMTTDSLPLEVLQKMFDPPEDTMPMIETMATSNGTITITYYSP